MQVQFIFVYLGLLCKFDCSFGVPSWCTSAFERGLKKVDFCTKKAHFLPKSAMTGVWESPVQSWKHKEVIFHVSSHGDAKSFGGFLQKLDFWPKNGILDPKKSHFGHFGPKRACRVAKWAYTWIMNVSKVALVCAYSMSTQEWMLLGKKRYAIWL